MPKKITKGGNVFQVFLPSYKKISEESHENLLSEKSPYGNSPKNSFGNSPIVVYSGIQISSPSQLIRVRGKGKDIIIIPVISTMDTQYFLEIPRESAIMMYQVLSGGNSSSAIQFLYGDISLINTSSKEEFIIDERIPQ